MKKLVYTTILAVLPFLLTSCSSEKLFGAPHHFYSNFFSGLWDGAFFVLIWIWSLFDTTVQVYNGDASNWYLWGFVFGVIAFANSSE